MRRVDVDDAGTQLSRLLDEVEAGERVIIARAGEPIAVLVPYLGPKRRLGLFAGQAKMHDDFDQLPGDIVAALGMPT